MSSLKDILGFILAYYNNWLRKKLDKHNRLEIHITCKKLSIIRRAMHQNDQLGVKKLKCY